MCWAGAGSRGGPTRNCRWRQRTRSPRSPPLRPTICATISNTGLYAVSGNWRQQPVLPLIRRPSATAGAGSATDERGGHQRVIWPVALAYYEQKQIVAAWCTLREDFRNFRTDRIVFAEKVERRFGRRRAVLAREWEDSRRAEQQDRDGQ